MGEKGVQMTVRPAVVPPLEQLLAIPVPASPGISLKVAHPEFFHTKFIRGNKRPRSQDRSRILTARFVFNDGSNFHDVPLYETSEIDTIMLVEIKEPETITPAIFQGEIGERMMRATLGVLLARAERDHIGFSYEILQGFPRKIIGISKHELVAFGKFANIYIYQTLPAQNVRGSTPALLTNPLWSPDAQDVAGRIGTEFFKERFRGCFKDVKGEVDALVRWQYAAPGETLRQGYIVCEAKTGVLRKGPGSEGNLAEVSEKLSVLGRVFPDHEISYLVMATPDYLYDREDTRQHSKTGVVVPSMKNIYAHLVVKGIPFMLLDFRCSSDDLFRNGQYILERYKQSHRRKGKFEWEDGRVRLDRNNGMMELNIGGRREIYRLNEQGNWVPFVQPRRP